MEGISRRRLEHLESEKRKLVKTKQNKTVDAMPTNARLFHFDQLETNRFRLGHLSEVGIASL